MKRKRSRALAQHDAHVLDKLKTSECAFLDSVRDDGIKHKLVGVDEVGMGAIAGPVTVCCIHVPFEVNVLGIRDSKKIKGKYKEVRRQGMADALCNSPGVVYSIWEYSNKSIDSCGIVFSWEQCVVGAIKSVVRTMAEPDTVFHVLIDGERLPKEAPTVWDESTIHYHALPKGDDMFYSIGAASIVAKAHRDAKMTLYDASYPGYEFGSHKGYGVAAHYSIIRQLGLSSLHRLSFGLQTVA